MPAATDSEAVGVLRRLIRYDTANPPGSERPAQEYLAGLLRDAGLEVVLAGPDPARPNLVARLRGTGPGPVLGLLSHVDTVHADPDGWRHDPWSGALDEGCVWGRGALDMKSQTAAEVVAACGLAREGWRPPAGDLLVICVADEEVGGTGAEWLCSERPELVRCDYLLNEGGGAQTAVDGRRLYGVSVGEKGVFSFTLSTRGVPGHASLPGIADNAILRLAPLLERIAARTPGWDVTPAPRALLEGLDLTADDPPAALAALGRLAPALAPLVEAMLRVTLAPTMAAAGTQINVIPAEARVVVDCRTPPGLGADAVLARVREVLGAEGHEVSFTETLPGNASPVATPLMDLLRRWVDRTDPGALCLPTVFPAYSDSRTFRAAFGDLVAYGFFPHRHMRAEHVAALVHGRDERIDVRDLALATDCYRSVAVELLSG